MSSAGGEPSSPPRAHGALGRLGALVVRKRGIVLAPLFAASVAFVRPCAREPVLEAGALGLTVAAWALRAWAMGYRNWVRGPGERHLMVRGPYAWLRHPRYVANFLAGLAWFALVFDPVLVVLYCVLYWALLGVVIVREEEKLAQDYAGHAEWRARVPALVPRPWRGPWRGTERGSSPDAADAQGRWEPATVLRGLEPLKLALFLAALGALAWARRSGEAEALRARLGLSGW